MEPRRILLLAVLAIGFTGMFAVLCLPDGQAASQQADSSGGDASYHQTSQSTAPNRGVPAARKVKPATAPDPHPQSLATLSSIAIFPSSISITGPHYNQRLVIEGTFADGHQEELTSSATVAISDSSIAKVDGENMVLPLRDGQATITASVRAHRATAPLIIKDSANALSWSFRNDVLPVMTKVGCNSGPCEDWDSAPSTVACTRACSRRSRVCAGTDHSAERCQNIACRNEERKHSDIHH